jgi:hypothetical protein
MLRAPGELVHLDDDDVIATYIELFVGVQGWPGPCRRAAEHQGRLRDHRDLAPPGRGESKASHGDIDALLLATVLPRRPRTEIRAKEDRGETSRNMMDRRDCRSAL